MSFWDLLFTASVPSLEVLIVTGLGTFIASDFVGILSEEARSFMNRNKVSFGLIVFYVFNPSLVGSNLADTVTAQSLVEMWFMPINILITFLCGSALGWILIKVTRAPSQLKALIMGICSAGNVGNLMIIVVPAICGEPDSPFGNEETCSSNGLAYASLSMAIGAIYIWTYVYNIMRVSSLTPPPANINGSRTYLEFAGVSFAGEPPEVLDECQTEALLPYRSDENVKEELRGLRMFSYAGHIIPASLEQFVYKLNVKKFYVPLRVKCVEWLKIFAEKINLKKIFAPSTCGALIVIVLFITAFVNNIILFNSYSLHCSNSEVSTFKDCWIFRGTGSSSQEVIDRRQCSSSSDYKICLFGGGRSGSNYHAYNRWKPSKRSQRVRTKEENYCWCLDCSLSFPACNWYWCRQSRYPCWLCKIRSTVPVCSYASICGATSKQHKYNCTTV